jgi:hypothetical protein
MRFQVVGEGPGVRGTVSVRLHRLMSIYEQLGLGRESRDREWQAHDGDAAVHVGSVRKLNGT